MLLKERRLRGDMIEVFKVLKGVNKVKVEEWFDIVEDGQRRTRQNTVMNEEGEAEPRQLVLKNERF